MPRADVAAAGLAVRDDGVGEARQPVFEESVELVSEVRIEPHTAALGDDLDRRPGEYRGQHAERRRRCQERLDDIDLLAAQQSHQLEQRQEIELAKPVERMQLNAGAVPNVVLERLSGVERRDDDAETLLVEPARELDQLALGAADAQVVDQQEDSQTAHVSHSSSTWSARGTDRPRWFR